MAHLIKCIGKFNYMRTQAASPLSFGLNIKGDVFQHKLDATCYNIEGVTRNAGDIIMYDTKPDGSDCDLTSI